MDETVAELDSFIFGEFNNACPTRRKNVTKKDRKKPWTFGYLKNLISKCQKQNILFKQNKISVAQYEAFEKSVT